MFMEIHTFINASKNVESKRKFVSSTKFCNERYTLNVSYMFKYYVALNFPQMHSHSRSILLYKTPRSRYSST
jgi:hypothetical protein